MISYWGHQDNPFAPDEPDPPRCPICGAECETVYKIDDDIIGCDFCIEPDDYPGENISSANPWEEPRCMEDY